LECKQKFQLKVSCTNGHARGIIFEEALQPFYQKPSDRLTYELGVSC